MASASVRSPPRRTPARAAECGPRQEEQGFRTPGGGASCPSPAAPRGSPSSPPASDGGRGEEAGAACAVSHGAEDMQLRPRRLAPPRPQPQAQPAAASADPHAEAAGRRAPPTCGLQWLGSAVPSSDWPSGKAACSHWLRGGLSEPCAE